MTIFEPTAQNVLTVISSSIPFCTAVLYYSLSDVYPWDARLSRHIPQVSDPLHRIFHLFVFSWFILLSSNVFIMLLICLLLVCICTLCVHFYWLSIHFINVNSICGKPWGICGCDSLCLISQAFFLSCGRIVIITTMCAGYAF